MAEQSLYQEIKAAGIPMDCHESDLYFKRTDESMKILAKYPLQKKNSSGFTNQVSHDAWIDVPFAYDPFWEKRQAHGFKKKNNKPVVEPIPDDFPVRPLKPEENPPGKATCGHCHLSWDDNIPTQYTPAPSARCPFEYYHLHPEITE